MNKLIMFFVLVTLIISAGCKKHYDAVYGKPVQYTLNKTIVFPDLDVTFVGQREESAVTPGGMPYKINYYDFKVKNKKEEKTVTWADNVGIINPVNFKLGDEKFVLELMYSVKAKVDMDAGQLIIVKES